MYYLVQTLVVWTTCILCACIVDHVVCRFFRQADAALVAFDISERESFLNATKDRSEDVYEFTTWLKEVRLRVDDSRAPVIILGKRLSGEK